MHFRDRFDAGRVLASQLTRYRNRREVVVLALPRGGVPVASEVAQALNAPLDVFVVRKLGVPGIEELALGAIASGGVRVLNEPVVQRLEISSETIERVVDQEKEELERRERLYRGTRRPPEVRDRLVILVDDGLATGSTMRAAVAALRQRRAGWIVVAVPVGSPDTSAALKEEADEVVCPWQPEDFFSVGLWYGNFTQTTDEEVRQLLAQAAEPAPSR
jgi:putative phosphoribosyl transferase